MPSSVSNKGETMTVCFGVSGTSIADVDRTEGVSTLLGLVDDVLKAVMGDDGQAVDSGTPVRLP